MRQPKSSEKELYLKLNDLHQKAILQTDQIIAFKNENGWQFKPSAQEALIQAMIAAAQSRIQLAIVLSEIGNQED